MRQIQTTHDAVANTSARSNPPFALPAYTTTSATATSQGLWTPPFNIKLTHVKVITNTSGATWKVSSSLTSGYFNLFSYPVFYGGGNLSLWTQRAYGNCPADASDIQIIIPDTVITPADSLFAIMQGFVPGTTFQFYAKRVD